MIRICPECRQKTDAPMCPNDGFMTTPAAVFRAQEPERLLGTVFEGTYRIDGIIGRGGMGTVYRGTELPIGRPVAIKLINAQRAHDARAIERFEQEARIIARLNHPNIIRLVGFGAQGERHLYLVMELVEGRSLAEIRLPGAPMEPRRIVRIAAQILDALVEAHRNGVVHRDLKPTNVMVKSLGDRTDFVKILDFGVARDAATTAPSLLPVEIGVAIGSPMYMAPEQAAGRPVTGQADLYSLGVMLYELLTGQPPFRCATSKAYLTAHVHATVPHPTLDGMLLDGPLVDFILRCLNKLPETRPQGAQAALDELLAASRAPVTQLESHAVVIDVTHAAVVDGPTFGAPTQDGIIVVGDTPESTSTEAIAWPYDNDRSPPPPSSRSQIENVLAPQRRHTGRAWRIGAIALGLAALFVLWWVGVGL